MGGIAHAQLVSDMKPVLHIETRYFDIYAAESLREQASRLSSFADPTLLDIYDFRARARDLGMRRIPVLLSDRQYSLNGFSTLYFLLIVLCFSLASADPRSQLASFNDELYSVFLHELCALCDTQ